MVGLNHLLNNSALLAASSISPGTARLTIFMNSSCASAVPPCERHASRAAIAIWKVLFVRM